MSNCKMERQQILEGLDILSEAKALGVRFAASKPSDSGWISCHAIDREDKSPSAGININSTDCELGYYKDHGPTSDEGMSFFDLAVALGEFPDFISAYQHFREQVLGPNRQGKKNGQKNKSLGAKVAEYYYRDESGETTFKSIKFVNDDGEKDFRQFSKQPDGWKPTIAGVDLVPYNLPELLARPDERIFIVEGEKDADRLLSMEILATTNPMGAGSWKEQYDKFFRDREVVILSDNDERGEKHAEDVAAQLQPIAESVRVVHFPELPIKGDVSDFLDAGNSTQTLLDRADETPLWEPSHNPEGPAELKFKPFPVNCLSETLKRMVVEGSRAIGCDPSFIALPLLVVVGSVIGNTRRLRVKDGWNVPPILWGAVVGESGTQKSPAFRLVMEPIEKMEGKTLAEYDDLRKLFRQEMAHYEVEYGKWKKVEQSNKRTGEPPPEKPELKPPERLIVSDITVEALADRLKASPRGLCLACDELSAWCHGLNQYKGGKGADLPHFLKMFHADSIFVDRKKNDQPIHVPNAAVSIIGGIQPGVLRDLLQNEFVNSGAAARLVFVAPPRRVKKWTDYGIGEELKRVYEILIDKLASLEAPIGDETGYQPIVIDLTQSARKLFIDYFEKHANEQLAFCGEIAAAWSKLEETVVRIALILHYAKLGEHQLEPNDCRSIDESTIRDAIQITDWFKNETLRVYSMLRESEGDRLEREVIELISARGGEITPSELVRQRKSQFKKADDAEKFLGVLAKDDKGTWETRKPEKGGRPSRVFRLFA